MSYKIKFDDITSVLSGKSKDDECLGKRPSLV